GWTGRDGRRQSATGRIATASSAVAALLGGDEADAAVAILALADFPEPVFRAQLIEPCDKLRHRQGHAFRGAAPGLVVGIESAFRKRLRVLCGLNALGEIIDHRSQRFTGLFASASVSRFRISRQNSRSEGGDEFRSS